MPQTPKNKKKPTPKHREWTEVEDFFLTGNLGKVAVIELAFKLNREPGEVTERIKTLNLAGQLDEATRKARLAGFHVEGGSVSMTPEKSFEDDVKAGYVPAALVREQREREKNLPKLPDELAKAVKKIW